MCTSHVILADFYSNTETWAKLGTQGATFLHVPFSSIKPYREKLFNICFMPTGRQIPNNIPDERWWHLKLHLLQTYIFLCFKNLIQEAYSGFFTDGTTITPRVGMLLEDHPKELPVLSLKRRYSVINFTHCTLQSMIHSLDPNLMQCRRLQTRINPAPPDDVYQYAIRPPRCTLLGTVRGIIHHPSL